MADAADQVMAGDVAMYEAVKAEFEIALWAFSVFTNDDASGGAVFELGEELREVGSEGRGKDDNGLVEAGDGGGKARYVFALGHDAKVVFYGENFGGTGTKDSLYVGKDDFCHRGIDLGGVGCIVIIGGVKRKFWVEHGRNGNGFLETGGF
jgi:hypothetical protein